MALTVTESLNQLDLNVIGNAGLRFWVGTATFDSSYVTGGEAFDPTALSAAFTTVHGVFCAPHKAAGSVNVYHWDDTNSTIIANTAGAQVANGVDLSAETVYVLVVGV
jgi:hypothetical protein